MTRLLIAMRAPDQTRDWRTFTDEHPTLDEVLRHLRDSGEADGIQLQMASYQGGTLFSQDDVFQGTHVAIQLAFPLSVFIYRDPRAVELFATCWRGFCDAAQPAYAYFATESFELEAERRDNVSHLLSERSIPELLAAKSAWLSYLGPQLAQEWGKRLPRARENQDYVWLPSGALFVRDHDPLAESYLEDTPQSHGHFLETQLELRGDVPGVAALLQIVRSHIQGFKDYRQDLVRLATERGGPLGAWWQQTTIPQPPDYSKDLNEIHTLWATAYRRPGLGGVNQSFTLRSGDRQETHVIAPIVAKDGAEWVMPVNRGLFGVEDDVWTIPGIGLHARVRDLLAVAEQHPVAGQPPQVVVVFWKGVSQMVRDALTAMGTQVEVSAHPVPLIES
jgi:hypothetical protein